MGRHDLGGFGRGSVLIAGPTASGKSALALALAERFGGVVINADSMQVYADLEVLTARPNASEMSRAPHRLFGTVDANVNFSVGHWLRAIDAELSRTMRDGARAIVVGGTGLYFKALTQGLSAIPPVPEEIRATVRAEAVGIAPEALHARLAASDPLAAARIRPSDPQRILRALEVLAATGRSIVAWQGEKRSPLLTPVEGRAIFLDVPRALIAARINARFDAMMAEGALDEVRALAARGLDPALPAMRAHGVPGLIAFLEGRRPLVDAVAKGKADTRNYAKRQVTWFRHQLPGFEALAPEAAFERLAGHMGA